MLIEAGYGRWLQAQRQLTHTFTRILTHTRLITYPIGIANKHLQSVAPLLANTLPYM